MKEWKERNDGRIELRFGRTAAIIITRTKPKFYNTQLWVLDKLYAQDNFVKLDEAKMHGLQMLKEFRDRVAEDLRDIGAE